MVTHVSGISGRRKTDLCFVKLGGSLVTDKTRAYTPQRKVIARLAAEVRAGLDGEPRLPLLLAHGSGSFGHRAAEPYGTREGVVTPSDWQGFAHVAAAAARLNRIITDTFLDAGVHVLSLQPSASARCRNGELVNLSVEPIRQALEVGLVPLVYGDVALDEVLGGTIASTEELFVYLAPLLRPSRILLLGHVPGVLSEGGDVIPEITPATYTRWVDVLSGSGAVDVTGGMADKVVRMVTLVEQQPELQVQILTGGKPGLLTRVLLGDEPRAGTTIRG